MTDIKGGMDRYRELSEDWKDPSLDPESNIVARGRIESLLAVGGPFDGEPLTVPPGGQEVILPAAYADPKLSGLVRYRREGDRMVYLGPPDQTDEAHTDPEANTPRLVLPD
jgi:hypothetical protein